MTTPVIPHLDTPDADLDEQQLREKYAPVTLGPTWTREPDGSWHLPRLTLGWEVAGWMFKYLAGPNGEEHFELTNEQLRFVLWWYAVDERGEFTYRTGVLQRLKGWG